jgi:hypothetical protein
MKNIIKSQINLAILLVMILFTSCFCDEDKTETLFLNENLKKWQPEDTISKFIMKDEFDISTEFELEGKVHKGFNVIKYSNLKKDCPKLQEEWFMFIYTNSFFKKFQISAEGSNNELYICYDNFSALINLEKLNIQSYNLNIYDLAKNQFFSENNASLTLELLKNLELNNNNYSEVLKIEIKLENNSTNYLYISELFIAQKYGLIKVVYNNKANFERI